MPYCGKCGTQIAEKVAFCPNCGAPQSAAKPAGTPAQAGLAENVAGFLSYLVGWVTGLVFFLIDKRPFVRFHAAQSIVVFGGLHILSFVFGRIFGYGFLFGGWTGFGLAMLLGALLQLLVIILWVVCMVKAFQGERFKIPIAGDVAENLAGR